MRIVEWVIKPSSYCNLRCRYCYEWRGLGDTTRMPLQLWRNVAHSIIGYHRRLEDRAEESVATRIIWHGGEPFALPLAHFRALIEELRGAARTAGIEDRLTQCVQTNLTILSDGVVQLIRDHDLRIGISMDVVPGVRLSIQGAETESVVLRNMASLRGRGIRFGAITVLARHTCRSICEVFDFWAAQGVDFRILPLFSGPPERDLPVFDVGESELVDAMCRLFDHWMKSAASITVAPLDEWLATVLRHRMGVPAERYDRRREADSVLIVRPDGSVFLTNEVGVEGCSLGNLGSMSLEEWLGGPAYLASLDRSEAITERVCAGCEFRGSCDSFPAHTERFDLTGGRRCPVAHQVFGHIDRYLAKAGFGPKELRMLAEGAAA